MKRKGKSFSENPLRLKSWPWMAGVEGTAPGVRSGTAASTGGEREGLSLLCATRARGALGDSQPRLVSQS